MLIRLYTGFPTETPPYSLFWVTHNFFPALSSRTYRTLCQSGSDQASHFLGTEQWPSIALLTSDTGSFKLPLLQCTIFYIPYQILYLTPFEEYCSDEETLSQVLSKTYNLLSTPSQQPQLPCLRKW